MPANPPAATPSQKLERALKPRQLIMMGLSSRGS